MKITLKRILSALLLLILASMGGCGCGFDCSSDDEDNPAILTLGFSDSLPEDLKRVVIEVDSITFRRSTGNAIVVDKFTLNTQDENYVDADSFQVNLLDYRGRNQLVVISKREIPTGTYDAVSIEILVGDVNRSYVQLANDTRQVLNVQNGVLTLPSIRLSSGTQRFVIEFGLAQALQLSTTNGYLLTNTGVRIENTETAATLSGQVDSDLFDTGATCVDKSDPEDGNRIYLYRGIDLEPNNLADVFTSTSSPRPPTSAIAPFSVASLVQGETTGIWEFSTGYLPEGDYTLAFACDTSTDDSVNFNDLVIPLPANALWEISLEEGEEALCNLELNGDC